MHLQINVRHEKLKFLTQAGGHIMFATKCVVTYEKYFLFIQLTELQYNDQVDDHQLNFCEIVLNEAVYDYFGDQL
jgi:hypothetical protein